MTAPLCILILISINYRRDKSTGIQQRNIFLSIAVLGILGMCAEWLAAVQYQQAGLPARVLVWVMVLLGAWLKLASLMRTFILLDYVLYQDEKRNKLWKRLGFCINLLFAAALLLNVKLQFFFSFSPENTVVKGPFYLLMVPVYILPALCAVIDAAPALRVNAGKAVIHLMAFVPPTLAATFMDYFLGTYLLWDGIALMLLFAYLFIVRQDAGKDALTQLSNRRSLEEYLKELKKDIPYAFVMMDLNDFKKINDEYGHFEGDRALRVFSEAIQASVRQEDFVARFGGDEFCVIAKGVEYPELLVRRIEENLAAHSRKQALPYTIDFGYGQGVYQPGELRSPKEFMKYIDELMYENKQQQKKSMAES